MTQSVDGPGANISKLGDTYDIVSELPRDATRAMYLARHRALGRDVVISIVQVPGGQANDALTHFTWDARLLATLRHDNVVPVLEGRWLDSDSFAVVHALLRGSTLADVLTTTGPFSPEQAAKTLEQAVAGLEWARTNGIIHRQLSARTVGFEEGTRRVMLTLGFTPLEPNEIPDPCSDVRTLGALAWSLLAGEPYETAGPRSGKLAERRPDLDAAVVGETYAMLGCHPGSERRDVGAFIATLFSTSASRSPHAAPAYPLQAVPPSASSGDAVIVVGTRTSPGPAALAVVAALVLGAAFFAARDGQESRVVLNSADTVASSGEIAGSVSSAPMNQSPRPVDPGAAGSALPVPPPIPQPITPAPTYDPGAPVIRVPTGETTSMAPAQVVRPGVAAPLKISPPRDTVAGRQREADSVSRTPGTVVPPRDSIVRPRDTTPAIRDSSVKAADPCASSGAADQQRCFDAASSRGDAEMNRLFADVIVAFRRRANVGDGDPDPASVIELRAEQRQWVQNRAADCRRRADERDTGMWATRRAECFAEHAGRRTRELSQKLGTG